MWNFGHDLLERVGQALLDIAKGGGSYTGPTILKQAELFVKVGFVGIRDMGVVLLFQLTQFPQFYHQNFYHLLIALWVFSL